MKNKVLSIGQMRKLKELGVDTSQASMVCLFQDDESNIYDWDEVVEECSEFGDYFQHFIKDDEGNRNMVYMSLLEAKGGDYDHSYREDCAVFTLNDIFKLLPMSMSISNVCGEIYLSVEVNCSLIKYQFIYANGDNSYKILKQNKSVLQAAYEMLVWVAENGYLKTK